MKIFTVGFTKTSAESFFSRLKENGVRQLLDVRLNNASQLAGFAKKDDLRFFLKSICGIEYDHGPELAPTSDMLDEYKKRGGGRAFHAPWRNFLSYKCQICNKPFPDQVFYVKLPGHESPVCEHIEQILVHEEKQKQFQKSLKDPTKGFYEYREKFE